MNILGWKTGSPMLGKCSFKRKLPDDDLDRVGNKGLWKKYYDPHLSNIACISLVFLFLALPVPVLTGCGQGSQAPTGPPPVVEVAVTPVVQQDVPVYTQWIGTTAGLVNATIRPQVTGYLMKQDYKEGSFVKEGDILFEIDPRSFQTALDQARGQLEQARAKLGKTELDVKRYTPLARDSAISQQELDDAVQSNLAARAEVHSAQAAVDHARLNLDFTRVTSPIDGIAGGAEAQIGDLVGPGQLGELTVVSTVDPIKVLFSISEQEYMATTREILGGIEMGYKYDLEQDLELELFLADGSLFPHKGKFLYADRQVDMKTGTIRIAAVFPNPGNLLRPGQYARVQAMTHLKKGALLVPQRAVNEVQGQYQLAVVGSDNTVRIRGVKAAERVGSLWVIDEGLQPGENVVVEGIQKVRDGQTVKPKVTPWEPPSEPGPSSSKDGPSPSPTAQGKD